MIKAVLQCTDCLDDYKKISYLLAEKNVYIKKSKKTPWNIKINITVVVDDYSELNKIVARINQQSTYGMSIVKVNDLDKSWLHNLLL